MRSTLTLVPIYCSCIYILSIWRVLLLLSNMLGHVLCYTTALFVYTLLNGSCKMVLKIVGIAKTAKYNLIPVLLQADIQLYSN